MNDQGKLEELYRRYRVLMYRAAFSILNNRQDAEDAVQDAFVKIYDRIDDIKEVDSQRTRSFLMVVTRNVCLNELRSKRHESGAELEELDIAAEETVEDAVFSNIGVEVIEDALRTLPENYRDILYLTVFREYDLRGAAELLGITYENAKSRLQRARKKLAELLNADYPKKEARNL